VIAIIFLSGLILLFMWTIHKKKKTLIIFKFNFK